ncbi:MAG: AzlC family ABC transporter permease [Anaerolineae bacterium]|nr:AzlC family ABC transporter permease [Anaerolineae bacterium]
MSSITSTITSAAESAVTPTPRSEFWKGIRDTIPLMIGALPFGLIFGALAVSNGLSPLAAICFSAIVFAGSSQFIGANLLKTGASIPLIVLTTFIVNVRHALYSATLGPHLKHLSQRWLLPLAFWLTDETFAITVTHYEQEPNPHQHWYQFGSSISMYLNWNFWTIVGLVAASKIEHPESWGLQFAMVVTFTGMVIVSCKTRPILLSIVVASITAFVTYPLPHKLFLIISAAAGIAAGVWAENTQWKQAEVEAAAGMEAKS